MDFLNLSVSRILAVVPGCSSGQQLEGLEFSLGGRCSAAGEEIFKRISNKFRVERVDIGGNSALSPLCAPPFPASETPLLDSKPSALRPQPRNRTKPQIKTRTPSFRRSRREIDFIVIITVIERVVFSFDGISPRRNPQRAAIGSARSCQFKKRSNFNYQFSAVFRTSIRRIESSADKISNRSARFDVIIGTIVLTLCCPDWFSSDELFLTESPPP